jgi:Cof subfamily protein (haloacid dehalogenase superfamily)
MTRPYDALVLDVDGTLLDDAGRLAEHTRSALHAARAQGVVVMLATGRSEHATRALARELELDAPCIVYNGAGVYSPKHDRMLEHPRVPERAVTRVLSLARQLGLLALVNRADGQYATSPRTGHQRRALSGFKFMLRAHDDAVPRTGVRRMTVLSEQHPSSLGLLVDVQRAVDTPVHLTHFLLAQLSWLRDSPMRVVDVQPSCRGKAEALRVLSEHHGIAPARVIAVGDADNDIEMLRAAGLGVAMGNATPDAAAAADRQIGSSDTTALADLITEAFLR